MRFFLNSLFSFICGTRIIYSIDIDLSDRFEKHLESLFNDDCSWYNSDLNDPEDIDTKKLKLKFRKGNTFELASLDECDAASEEGDVKEESELIVGYWCDELENEGIYIHTINKLFK